jgi:hypothetical protein
MTVQRHGAFARLQTSRRLSILALILLVFAVTADFANERLASASTIVNLPGRFEVEDYSSAGQGVGYYDTTPGNTNGKYRSDDVDIETTADSSGAFNVSYTAAGEWLRYDVNVQTTSSYIFTLRAATPNTGKIVHIEVDGVNVTGPMSVPNTGGWQNWTNVASAPITLTAGSHTVKLVIDTSGINLNYISVTTVTTTTAPLTTTAIRLPGRLELEDYRSGGQGVGYHDTTAGNSGGKYRTDSVDIETTSDSTGAYNIGWTAAGEWLSYDVDVLTSTTYFFTLRAATPYSGKTVHIKINGVNVSGTVALPKTGGSQAWRNVTFGPINLTAGRQTMQLVLDTGSVNINYLEVVAAGTTAAEKHGWGSVVAGDEFSYTGAPDSTKWVVYNSAGHNGKGVRSPAAWNVANGAATVTGNPDGTTGGMAAKFARRTYGRWEARVKTNARDPKYHPVLLLWPEAGQGTTCPEIDYMEGGSITTRTDFYLHYGCEPKQTYSIQSIDQTHWHTYAVEWTPDHVYGYIDGVKWFSDTTKEHIPTGVMFQTIQLDWFPDGTATKTSTMTIDWIRVYNP